MNNVEFWEKIRPEREFYETQLGKLFRLFENAHGRAWQLDGQDSVSDKRLTEAWDKSNAARRALLDALMALERQEKRA